VHHTFPEIAQHKIRYGVLYHKPGGKTYEMGKLIKSKKQTMARTHGDIKSEIENEFCPVHRERPVVNIVNENDINIYGCCTEFEDNCRQRIRVILKDSEKEQHIKSWKKGFRNDLLG